MASGRGGLSADQIATMSKHRGERIFEAYITELFPAVMLVMAGFRAIETWWVSRTEVELPWTDEQCALICFPKIVLWQEQQGSLTGDKDKSAVNFLYEVLPYLARVILQDGPYWKRNFPNHEYTELLYSRMPDEYAVQYETWSRTAIRKAKDIAAARNLISLDVLNTGTRHAFDHSTRATTELSREVAHLQEEVQGLVAFAEHQPRQNEFMNNMMTQVLAAQRQQQQWMGQLAGFMDQMTVTGNQRGLVPIAPRRAVLHTPPTPPEGMEWASVSEAATPVSPGWGDFGGDGDMDAEPADGAELATTLFPPPPAPPVVANPRNVNNQLCQQPRLVEFPGVLPLSMVELAKEWVRHDFDRLAPPVARKSWPSNKKAMYSKWLNLMTKMKERAKRTHFCPEVLNNNNERLFAAAERFDEEREDRSMDKFRVVLQRAGLSNGTIKHRQGRLGL